MKQSDEKEGCGFDTWQELAEAIQFEGRTPFEAMFIHKILTAITHGVPPTTEQKAWMISAFEKQ
jgi:hypothetical protein